MRKTSHDGADTSSITSGIDSERKSATNFNKMKKSSIKRKVQNFSHESDDGIIEPLLQTEKEKIEIANRSAKYLLNKSKTESIHEKDNKVTDGYADKSSIPLPVSSISNVITNNIKDSSMSTSNISGTAPIHNHMNTNIFSAFDVSTGLTTTKNPILVEIDTSKHGRFSPSPLIFTTAKIHTDTKTKPMDPIQLTPVPILSTVESNKVKAGVISEAETKNICLTGKPEITVLQPYKDKTFSPPVTIHFSNSDIAHSSHSIKNEPVTTVPLKGFVNLSSKNVNAGQLLNTVITTQSTSNDILKNKSIKDEPNIHKTISTPDQIKESTEIMKPAANSKNKPENSSVDKLDERFRALNNLDNKILQAPLELQNQDNNKIKSSDYSETIVTSMENEKIINTSVSSNKKLLRQKNTPSEVASDSGSNFSISEKEILVNEAEKNACIKSDIAALPQVEHISEISVRTYVPKDIKDIYKKTSKDICITTVPEAEIKPTSCAVFASTSKAKSITEPVNLKSTLPSVNKDVPKFVRKTSIVASDVKDSKVPTTSVVKSTTVGASTSNKLSAIPVSVKPDTLSSLSISSQSVKTDTSVKCPVTTINSTLPSYIVSTSKTKIGSTFTSTTPATTSKPQTQKMLVSTTSAQVKPFTPSGSKSTPSTSATNGTKQTVFSKQAKSKLETTKKDGRA